MSAGSAIICTTSRAYSISLGLVVITVLERSRLR